MARCNSSVGYIESIKNSRKNRVIAFLLGLLSTNNVVYLFVIGNTPVLAFYVFSAIVTIYLVFDAGKIVLERWLPTELILFFSSAFLSVIIVALFSPVNLRLWFVGIISLTMFIIALLDVYLLYNKRKYIIYGVISGLFINFAIVIFEYLSRLRGVVFNLADVFPALGIARLYIGNDIRCQGLFCEPGHLMRYVAIVFFLILPYIRTMKNRTKALLVFMLIVVITLTRSNALLFFVMGVVALAGLMKYEKKTKKIAVLVSFLLVTAFAVIASNYIPFLVQIRKSIEYSFFSSFLESNIDTTRIAGMKGALGIIKEYPVTGCGWNLLATLMGESGYMREYVKGSYSFMLTLIAELGIGAITFIVFLVKRGGYLIKHRSDVEQVSCGVGLFVYLCLCVTTDFVFDPGIALLFGFSLGLLRKDRVGGKIIDYNANTI